MPPSADESSRATTITGFNRIVLWVMGFVLRVWSRTIRMTIDPVSRTALGTIDEPIALATWHNRLFLAGECTRRYRNNQPFHGLISASKDGAWLVGFFEMIGIKAIRGSSSWGAREAASAMIAVARSGGDIAITPDGPRGPCYEFKPGGLIISRRANVPLLLVGMQFKGRIKVLRSWDRFIVPWPFTKVHLHCRIVRPTELPRDRTQAIADLTRLMHELNGTTTAATDPARA
ncbi:DUF374 domain-containing protein [Synoicihabitans lomoniglobus]|uniref:DUF374 domain-containing protein n=1 Tax=Synoicihabitans lomoniglobus TaxID=2909285 RepID=A0AAF0CLM1_9BACT|nr:DUF374 domain-containing protein [Opitutaceae bacterium LMO-M01]WED63048.1 DUF374 domain-containing protein [Opitutaceae bacterium LMO-M01]